ncbi:MAG: DNA mismatch repair endonuclease MutL [Candidatus Omnitrophica bacterium]|nr:DNA mismatch repair endonuclease MutL [Candidatus Omnitrophota bacterium]
MGAIRVLPEEIANKIAAGEVIERPASVVKELIENALDAGATQIEVALERGGKGLIRVSDNGTGMDREDARLAFQRHATSKVKSLADLDRIGSYGFRGEALPSIAAVSKTRLITRPEKASVGTEVVVEGGRLLAAQDQACRIGTIVEVRELFFNTPARRKFLKSDSTELGHIQEMVSHLALPAPAVHITLKESQRTLLDLLPADRLASRAAAILGEGTAAQLLELDEEQGGIRLWGVIGKPSLNRSTRREIHLFVNRRWVRSLPFTYALAAGYHGRLPHDRFPAAVLFVDLDLGRVDVNVHPTKQQVRISNEPEVTSLISEAVKRRLARAGDLASIFQVAGTGAGAGSRPTAMRTRSYLLESGARAASTFPSAVREREAFTVNRILGAVHNTFILAETDEGLMILDQHAAHERIAFEALLKSFDSGAAESQALLLEETLELPLAQRELLKRFLPMLAKVGFGIEEFGEATVLIRAVPAVFGEVNPVQLLRDFLEGEEEGKVRTALEDQREAVAALVACKRRSVKAGDPLTVPEIRSLLGRLAQCENPFNCPHGRPVFFTQSLRDIEKQFKRT